MLNKLDMNDKLKSDIEKLLAAHPELRNQQLAFGETDFSLTQDGTQSAICQLKEEAQAVIRGHSPMVEVRLSPIHGYGVFAREDIAEGEFIEECRLLRLQWRAGYPTDPTIADYAWGNMRCSCIECSQHGVTRFLALGLGSIYNHSDMPNAKYNMNFKAGVMKIYASKPIIKDEEIFITYGDKYFLIRDFWKNINKNRQLEKVARDKKQLIAAKSDNEAG